MKTRYFTLGIALVLLTTALGSVEASAKSFHAYSVGTCANKDDFSYTGKTPGHSCTAVGKSNLGQFTAQLVGEAQLDGKKCGNNGVEFVFVGIDVVMSFAAPLDQLFLQLSPDVTSLACFDSGVETGQVTFTVNGGTGRFAGATGTVVETFQFIGLAPPPSGTGFFGSLTSAFGGTVNLPKGDNGAESEN